MNLKAFFFDLDGTLLDSEVIYVEAVKVLLEEYGFRLPPREALKIVYGKSTRDIFMDLEKLNSGLFPSVEFLESEIRRFFLDLRSQRDVRILSSIDLLKRLSKTHTVAIVSGSPRQDIEDGIQIMGIEPHLEFYLGSEDYFPGKPDPACYQMAAEKLSIAPERCLVFEDSSAGVQAAKSAGMLCVGLRRPGAPFQDIDQADLILTDLAEFDLEPFISKS
jgi:HAD superfamily hydrolase (TIGR01509 family)